ncbi:MAG: flagellar basal body L-ring protein FlgH [Phycisphaeraceae bacterium]|nr:flagellar basal body L-ring protein FlgH [Phycisphaeraceae bacterium]
MRTATRAALIVVMSWMSAPASGQSLFHAPIPPPAAAPAPEQGQTPASGNGPIAPAPSPARASDGAPTLAEASLMVVVPPKPRTYQKHDKIEIIINETSIQKYEQSLDAKKKYDLLGELKYFPSIQKLLEEATLTEGIGTVKPKVGLTADGKFKGDGTYERKDRFTARISALVVDVKPNGLLVVEAKESISSDEETKTMVLAGICDPKDVTNTNTVQSSQLANLNIHVEHSGQIKDSATKGLIPRLFETLFNF